MRLRWIATPERLGGAAARPVTGPGRLFGLSGAAANDGRAEAVVQAAGRYRNRSVR